MDDAEKLGSMLLKQGVFKSRTLTGEKMTVRCF